MYASKMLALTQLILYKTKITEKEKKSFSTFCFFLFFLFLFNSVKRDAAQSFPPFPPAACPEQCSFPYGTT